MNELQVFNFNGNEVRTVTDEQNNVWWVAKDVCNILGYLNHSKALQDHVDMEDKLNNKLLLSLGQRGGWIINESGLYSLILRSNMPQAKTFKRWVTSEVLPSTRKHGAYMTTDKLEELMANPQTAIRLFEALQEEQTKRKALEATTIRLMHSNKTYTATELAKELGYRNVADFNKQLEQDKIQYKRNGTWLPFAKYTEAGYCVHKQSDKGYYYTKWTQKGRDFVLSKYTPSNLINETNFLVDRKRAGTNNPAPVFGRQKTFW